MNKHESRIKALQADLAALQERLTLYTELGYNTNIKSCQQDIEHIRALIAFENRKNSQIRLEK